MGIKLYMDVHVPDAITVQLRRRGIQVVTAQEHEASELADSDLLQRASDWGCLTFTQDIRFRALAEDRQRVGRSFNGLVFGHQLGGTLGQFVQDLELIATASDTAEWENVVERIPFK